MIKVLDQKTIDQIAAGEVIERPMSVVKELVENSIDAGATSVTVEIREGGTSLIRVTDNGCGIPEEEVRLSCVSHATSKLTSITDLDSMATLGFRGEALSTISAVTEMEMITKVREAETGVKFVVHGGKEMELSSVGAPEGTTIVARNLFYNTPARLKYLKSNMTEGAYISDMMSHIALAEPGIAFRLIANSRTVLETSGSGSLSDAVYQIYGRDIAKSLLPVDSSAGAIRVTGFAGKPFLAKGNRSFENYYVNKRYIKSHVITRAIEEAYKTYVMQHRFPFTVLFFELPMDQCDINVHPAKREFRFSDEKTLFSACYHAVTDALKEKEMIPDMDKDYGQRDKLYQPKREIRQETEKKPFTYDAVKREPVPEVREKEEFFPSEKMPEKARVFQTPGGSKGDSYSLLEAMLPQSYREKLNEQEKREEEVPRPSKEEYRQETLQGDAYLSKEALPRHQIIGQVFKTYWITEYDNCLYLMDQHAAHEKVNYETFLKEFRNRAVVSQQIFPPKVFHLSGREKAAVMDHKDYFEKTGFEIEDFGGNDVALRSVPVNLIGLDGADIFQEFSAYLADGISGLTEDIFVHKLATMGCKAAIKGNQQISVEEAQILIERLLTLDNPYTCPHGRPTIIRMSKEELDKKFKRIVE